MLLRYARNEISGLSVLRLGLAIYLMLFHTLTAYQGLPHWLRQFASSGYMATSMFFLLSGFILSHVYFNADGLKMTPKKFLKTRFYTLYPIHLIGLALSGMILLVQFMLTGVFVAVADIPPSLTGVTNESLLIELHWPAVLGSLLSHLLLLHAWNPFFQTFNIPAWSISALMFFYFVFVLWGNALINVKRPMVTLIGLNLVYLIPPVVLIGLGEFNSVATGFLHTNPLARLPEYLAGIVLYRVTKDTGQCHMPMEVFLALLLGSIVLLVAMNDALLTLGPAGYYIAHNGGLMLPQCLILVLFAGVREFRTVWLRDLVKRLGNASLSMFILHLPLFFLLTRIEKFIRFLLVGNLDQPWWPQIKSMPISIAYYPLMVLLVLVLSLWCQERLVLNLRGRLLKRQ